jgi:FeS assembly SUF system protein
MTEPDGQLDLLASIEPNITTTSVEDQLIADIIAALRTVHDPEIPVNIYDLGLIYRIEPKAAGLVEIDMTLTAPGCPVAGEMLNWVQRTVIDVKGITKVDVRLTFDPPWDNSRMSDDVKLELGLL